MGNPTDLPPASPTAGKRNARRVAVAAGIGSAALVAALLYCRNESRRKGPSDLTRPAATDPAAPGEDLETNA